MINIVFLLASLLSYEILWAQPMPDAYCLACDRALTEMAELGLREQRQSMAMFRSDFLDMQSHGKIPGGCILKELLPPEMQKAASKMKSNGVYFLPTNDPGDCDCAVFGGQELAKILGRREVLKGESLLMFQPCVTDIGPHIAERMRQLILGKKEGAWAGMYPIQLEPRLKAIFPDLLGKWCGEEEFNPDFPLHSQFLLTFSGESGWIVGRASSTWQRTNGAPLWEDGYISEKIFLPESLIEVGGTRTINFIEFDRYGTESKLSGELTPTGLTLFGRQRFNLTRSCGGYGKGGEKELALVKEKMDESKMYFRLGSFGARVLDCLQASTSTWITGLDGESGEKSSGNNAQWKRVKRAVPLKGLRMAPPVPLRDVEYYDSKRGDTYRTRKFFIDGSTLAFTSGNHPAPCDYLSCMRVISQEKEETDVPLSMFGMRDIEAMWRVGDLLVFAFHERGGDIGTRDIDLSFLDMATGKWIFFPFDETSQLLFLPDWRSAKIARLGGAVVFASYKGAVAIWPKIQQWAPLRPETGEAIESMDSLLARARPKTDILTKDELKGHIESLVAEAFTQIATGLENYLGSEFEPYEMVLYLNGAPKAYYSFCAVKYRPAEWPSQDNGYAGCFLVPQQKPIRLVTLGFFKAVVGISDAYFFDVSKNNVVTIREMDMTHGLGTNFHKYSVDPIRGQAKEFKEKTEQNNKKAYVCDFGCSQSDKPGKCPVCGRMLTKREEW